MDFYFVTLDGRDFPIQCQCDVETSVKCLDVSHSEFNLNSINTDKAIFMEMILAQEVAPEMTHIHQRMRGPNLLEKFNKGKNIKTQ